MSADRRTQTRGGLLWDGGGSGFGVWVVNITQCLAESWGEECGSMKRERAGATTSLLSKSSQRWNVDVEVSVSWRFSWSVMVAHKKGYGRRASTEYVWLSSDLLVQIAFGMGPTCWR